MSDPLTWPPEWRRHGKASWVVGMLLLFGLAVAALAVGAVDLASGNTGRGAWFELGGLFSLAALSAVYARRARRRTSVEWGELPVIGQHGVLIRYSLWIA